MNKKGYVDLLGSWEFVDFSGKRVGVFDYEIGKDFRFDKKPCAYKLKFGLVHSSLLADGIDGMDYLISGWPEMVWDLFMNLDRKEMLYYYSRMVGKRRPVNMICWIYEFNYFGKKRAEIMFNDAINDLDNLISERSTLHILKIDRYNPEVLKDCGFKQIKGTAYFVCGKLNGKNGYQFDVELVR